MILVPVLLVLLILLLIAAAVVYKRRRRRRERENAGSTSGSDGPTSAWLGGGASSGAWSRLDMASRFDLASPSSPSSRSPFSAPVPYTQRTQVVLPARALSLTVTEFEGEAVEVQTLSTPRTSSEAGHSGESSDVTRNEQGAGTPSTAAPTDGHSAPSAYPYPYPHPPSYDPYESTAARTDDGHSLFAGSDAHSPFEIQLASESPLHWQDEPALADSRPTSLDAHAHSHVGVEAMAAYPGAGVYPGNNNGEGSAVRHSIVYDPAHAPVFDLRGSTVLAYRDERDEGVPAAFDPARDELV